MKGIQMALEGAEEEKEAGGTVILVGDSQAAIRAVEQITSTGKATTEEGRSIESSIRRLAQKKRKFKLVWVEAHIG